MEYVVLGLLLLRPRTIYELNTAFKQTVSLFYSASYGSLQIAVKKLLTKGFIISKESVENGRHRKTFSVTEAGGKAFFIWINDEIPKKNLEVVGLSKLFFLGLVIDLNERRTIIGRIRNALAETISELEMVEKQIHAYEIPENHRTIFLYQVKTLDYGIWAHKAALKWFTKLLSEMDKTTP